MERNAAGAADNLIIQLDGETELRPVRPEDAEDLYTAVKRNYARLHQWLAWATVTYSPDDSRAYAAAQATENSQGLSLTMSIRHKGVFCGSICLHRFDRFHRNTSLGYWIDEGHEGKGIITAACRAMLSEGFGRFGLHRIEIRCATWNHRSSAVPRRLDFAEEGILREAEWLHDKWVDLRVFSMLARDWKQNNPANPSA